MRRVFGGPTTVTRDTLSIRPGKGGHPMILEQYTRPGGIIDPRIKQTTRFRRGSGGGPMYGHGPREVSSEITRYYSPIDSTEVGRGRKPTEHIRTGINRRLREAGRTTLDGGYYQQGGAIEDLRISEETMLEAVLRYFHAKGVTEEELFVSGTQEMSPEFIEPAAEFLSRVEGDNNF